MAKSSKNIAIEGVSGMIANLVFRTRKADGKVFISHRPSAHKKPPPPGQKKSMERFQQAVIYVKAALADTATKAAYAKKALPGQTAYNVAIADYMNAPDIEDVDFSNYTGRTGSNIIITATDSFEVVKVYVNIVDGNGMLAEEGNAIKDTEDKWLYTAENDNATLLGSRITISAYDNPGNKTEKAVVL